LFVDIATVEIKPGNGGNGSISFRREKCVPRGGPDGGDGGRGGNIIVIGTKNISTLRDFRYKRKYAAENGKDGKSRNMAGKNGVDLVIRVPLGTLIKESKSKKLIVDVCEEIEYVLLKGGKGGFGNQHFATSRRRSPHFARAGQMTDLLEVDLELKMLADVGIIGFPNAGKSSLLSAVSNANPKIDNYKFTTIFPNLGVVEYDGTESVWCDIPGIIQGASLGIGLGYQFLRHIERTKLLIHVIDISDPYIYLIEDKSVDIDKVVEDCIIQIQDKFHQINNELRQYNRQLLNKQQIIVFNKMDLVDNKDLINRLSNISNQHSDNNSVYVISAQSHKNTKLLVNYVHETLQKIRHCESLSDNLDSQNFSEIYVKPKEELFKIVIENGIYRITGKWIETLFRSTNFDDLESLNYFQKMLCRRGITKKLREMGIKENDTVEINNCKFDFI